MSYRKVDPRMWGDAKFRALSQDAQFLWVYLLTGPHTTALPGLYRASRLDMEDQLGWSKRRFTQRFGELERAGMVHADWAARVVYVPNARRYNPPSSANVCVSWRRLLENLPESPVARSAKRDFHAWMASLDAAFFAAWRRAGPEIIGGGPSDIETLAVAPSERQAPCLREGEALAFGLAIRTQDQKQDQKKEILESDPRVSLTSVETSNDNANHTGPKSAPSDKTETVRLAPAVGPTPFTQDEQAAYSAVRAFRKRLPRVADYDVEGWKQEWAWIGHRPEAERERVIQTLCCAAWETRSWRGCTPRHIRRFWQSYAAGELPWRSDEPGSEPVIRRADALGRGAAPVSSKEKHERDAGQKIDIRAVIQSRRDAT